MQTSSEGKLGLWKWVEQDVGVILMGGEQGEAFQ